MWEQEKLRKRTMRNFSKGEMNSTGKWTQHLLDYYVACNAAFHKFLSTEIMHVAELVLALKPTS